MYLQSSDDYMDNDWLNSFFEDPVLNDKMITDAVPAPRIRSEHSYSTVNNDPTSPFGLTKIEGITQNSGPVVGWLYALYLDRK